MRKKILAIVASDSVIGGHSVQARELQRYFANREDFEFRRYSIDAAIPEVIRKVRYVRTLANEISYLSRLLPSISWAEVLHIFSASYWSFLLGPTPALVMGKLLKKKVILNYHSGEADDHLSRWGSIVKPIMRLADVIVVPSEYLKKIFLCHRLCPRVISNSIPLERFSVSRNQRELKQPLRILCTRNFEPYYRVDLVVEAFREIKEKIADATLTLVGDGSERKKIEELVRKYCLKDVFLEGTVDNCEIERFYGKADVYLNASIVDNMPVSLMEAMASGLVIISSDAGGIPYLIEHDRNGILVPCNNARALADAAIEVYKNRDRWNSIRSNARKESKAFDNDVVCRRWANLYSQLAQE